jgi:hypothetical protein
MEKGEHDFKYKVDQVQESLADAHKAHLRQVCPALPFDIHTLAFAHSSLPTGCPCCASCALWHHTLPFDTHALPFAYPSLPTGCPCCASCALWQHKFLPHLGCHILVRICACCMKTHNLKAWLWLRCTLHENATVIAALLQAANRLCFLQTEHVIACVVHCAFKVSQNSPEGFLCDNAAAARHSCC